MSEADAALFSGENGAFVEELYRDHVLGRPVPDHWRTLFAARPPPKHRRSAARWRKPRRPRGPRAASGSSPS